MDIVIAFAACALLCVQTHRNHLMVKASKKDNVIVVNVNICKEKIDELA